MQDGVFHVAVECYSGYRGEETPRAFTLGDARIVVDEVLDRWLAPDHRYFKVRCGAHTWILRHDPPADLWELTMFRNRQNEI